MALGCTAGGPRVKSPVGAFRVPARLGAWARRSGSSAVKGGGKARKRMLEGQDFSLLNAKNPGMPV